MAHRTSKKKKPRRKPRAGQRMPLPTDLSGSTPPLEFAFRALVEKWRKDTQHTSSVKNMISHTSYKRIIKMGSDVLPLLFRELNVHRDHWLVALNAITGEDPVPPDSNFEEAVDAWLAWGMKKGYFG